MIKIKHLALVAEFDDGKVRQVLIDEQYLTDLLYNNMASDGQAIKVYDKILDGIYIKRDDETKTC